MTISSLDYPVSKNSFNKTILLIDFDDSFTFNIVSEFHKYKILIDVVNHTKVDKVLRGETDDNQYDCIILGPGPGHPNEYKVISQSIKKLILLNNKKIIGICLGHQMIMEILGYKIGRSQDIIHGDQQMIDFSNWKNEFNYLGHTQVMQNVSRYNSLCVLPSKIEPEKSDKIIYSSSNEIMGHMSEHTMSMQFHPESVGTNCPDIFFKLMINFMR